jgi:hypothetical protein
MCFLERVRQVQGIVMTLELVLDALHVRVDLLVGQLAAADAIRRGVEIVGELRRELLELGAGLEGALPGHAILATGDQRPRPLEQGPRLADHAGELEQLARDRGMRRQVDLARLGPEHEDHLDDEAQAIEPIPHHLSSCGRRPLRRRLDGRMNPPLLVIEPGVDLGVGAGDIHDGEAFVVEPCIVVGGWKQLSLQDLDQ